VTGKKRKALLGVLGFVVVALPLAYLAYRSVEQESPLAVWVHLHFAEVRRNPSVFDVRMPTLDADERQAAYHAIAASKSERVPAPIKVLVGSAGESIACTNVTLEGGANDGKKLGVLIRQPKPDADGRSLWQIQAMSITRSCTCSTTDCTL